MTFEEWWEENKEAVEDNCENRMDQYDAKYWLKEAFNEGFKFGQESGVS